jgi:glutamine synthetase
VTVHAPRDTTAKAALLAEADLIEAFIIDVNGVPRGKWLQRDKARALLGSGIAIPRSAFLLDIWGRDVVEGGIAYDTGDPDGLCVAVPHSITRMGWAEGNAVQAMLTMREADGSLFYLDPRGVLARVLERYAAAGLTPALGVELEFYLVDPGRSGGLKIAPRGADESGWRGWQIDAVGLGEIYDYEAVLREMLTTAQAQEITLETLVSESGPGQFEVTLKYSTDALRVADSATLFKRTIKHIARKHGLTATFMAKPYGQWAGSGMHVHMSVLDRAGNNIFAGSETRAAPVLYNALGGIIQAMPDTMLTQFLPPLRPRRACAHIRRLGARQPPRRLACHHLRPRRLAHRAPRRGRGLQPVPRLRLAARLRPLGHRDPGRPRPRDHCRPARAASPAAAHRLVQRRE